MNYEEMICMITQVDEATVDKILHAALDRKRELFDGQIRYIEYSKELAARMEYINEQLRKRCEECENGNKCGCG